MNHLLPSNALRLGKHFVSRAGRFATLTYLCLLLFTLPGRGENTSSPGTVAAITAGTAAPNAPGRAEISRRSASVSAASAHKQTTAGTKTRRKREISRELDAILTGSRGANPDADALTTAVSGLPLSLVFTASSRNIFTTGSTVLQANVSGGDQPYSYTFTGPGQIVQNGQTTKTATASSIPAGVQTFTVVAADNNLPAQTITGTVSVTVSLPPTAPTVANPIPPQSATIGQFFTYDIPANTFFDANGDALTYTVSGLPNGLTFTSPATINGSPAAVGVTTVKVFATDVTNRSVMATFSLTVAPTSLSVSVTASPTTILTTTSTLLSAAASGGTTPYTYTFSGPGTINKSGNTATVSGLPTGVQTFTVVTSDATIPIPQSVVRTVSVTVNLPPTAPTVANPIPPQSATVGQAFTYDIPPNTFADVNGGSLTYTVSGLPNGLTFTSPATISGVPSASGVSTIRVIATDNTSLSVMTTFTLTAVVAPLSLVFTASPTTLLTSGSTTLQAVVSGGTTPYTYTFSGPGTINQSGNTASVSSLSAGVQTFTVIARDATSPTSQSISGTVSVTVSEPAAVVVTPIVAQTVAAGQNFAFVIPPNTFSALNGNTLTYTVVGLPAGLTFTAPSTISGVPTVSGVFTVTVTATAVGSSPPNAPGPITRGAQNGATGDQSVSAEFTLTVEAPLPLSLTFTASPTAILTSGSTTLQAMVSGGVPAYIYAFSGPGTIAFAGNSATVSGLPVGVSTFTVVVTDAASPNGQTISGTVSVMVSQSNLPPVVATLIAPQSATAGQAFTFMIPSNTFSDPNSDALTYSVSGLPAGLTFTGPATISGVPSASGVSTVIVTATDPGSLSANTTFTLTVAPASGVTPTPPTMLTITNFTCFTTNNALSSVNFVVSYSNGAFTPALPNLFINGVTVSGQLGTPYTLNFDGNQSTLTVQDNATRSTYFVWNFRQACSVPVTPPAPTAPVAPGLPNQLATQGTPFMYTVPAFTGTAPISYTATGLPTGLSFDPASRIISGTPSLTGVSTVVISASNMVGQGSGQFTITVSASAVTPTPPATLTITSFTCNSPNSVLSSVNFVVSYSNGAFTPALPNLFINGVTVSGQLGTPYTLGFDGNQSTLTVQDNATRSTYFVWNFRQVCASQSASTRLSAEPVAPLQVRLFGNPVRDAVEFEVTGAEGAPVNLTLTDMQGHLVDQAHTGQARTAERYRFAVPTQSMGALLLRVSTGNQSKTVRILKVN